MRKKQSEQAAPIRVMLFDHIASMSGGEIALLNLVRHLDRRIVEPIVLLGDEGPLAQKLRVIAEVHILPMQAGLSRARKDALGVRSLLQAGALWNAIRYVWRVAAFIRSHRIDLVHTNSLKADLLGGMAAKLSTVPSIWHVRDRIADDYLPRKIVKTFKLLSQYLPTAIIANSYATAATLDSESGKGRSVTVVHDGTEIVRFEPVGIGKSNEVAVGLVGRISPWKGQDVFLHAVHRLQASHPDVKFRIIGAALFEEVEYEARIRNLVRELSLDDVVQFTGFREDVSAEIVQLDILVHASTRAEPFGQVIIEGMSAGRPVVATNGGGVPEIVEDGVTGLLVPMNDADSMAAAIDILLKDPERARNMGRLGARVVQERFTISKTAREIEDIYLRVVGAVGQQDVKKEPDGPNAVRGRKANAEQRANA